MAAQIVKEWSGMNSFAPATQTKLLELLGKLKQENVNTLTVLVMGKGGVGKSSTVNSIVGERVVTISPFQVLPNGIAWISYLVKKITEVALNGSKSIFVDTKLIEGPNPNGRGKTFIPLILLIQFFFAIKPIERAIRTDIARESRPAWEMRDASLASRKF